MQSRFRAKLPETNFQFRAQKSAEIRFPEFRALPETKKFGCIWNGSGTALADPNDTDPAHLEPLFSVYAWYIPFISQAYADVTNMPGIYVVYPCIYMVYPHLES